MVETFLLFLALVVLLIWALRLRETIGLLKGPHIIDESSRKALTQPVKKISVIIPARDEESNIRGCLESILNQDYPDYEVIVLDDRSSDKTAEIVKGLTNKYSNLSLVSIKSLPNGRTGKNNALTQGVKHAIGEWYLFTDADTVHQPQSISMAMGHAQRHQVDMLTLMPSLENITFWEKVVQPIAGGVLMLRFPLYKVNDPNSECAFANGQFILIKREVYHRVGGHEKVRDVILEDIALSKSVKSEAGHLHVANGAQLFRTRMYTDLLSIWQGWTRIYYSAFDKNPKYIFGLMGLIWLVSLFPYIFLFSSIYFLFSQGLNFFTLSFFGLTIFQFALIWPTLLNTYRFSRSDTRYILHNGLACLIVFAILTNAWLKILLNLGVQWRGHSYTEKTR